MANVVGRPAQAPWLDLEHSPDGGVLGMAAVAGRRGTRD